MIPEQLISELERIVGKEFVSTNTEELFIYSRDPGTMPPSFPDVVVMPEQSAQVQGIILAAKKHGVPVVPMGAGLVLSGLTRPLRGGIVVDMKRMNRIIEVNPASRYAVVEAGVSEGMLAAYLKKHHPDLKHSMPDAPPSATIGGNVAIHGSGHLSVAGGFHSDMLTGMEVVLPTGEVVKTGTCSVSMGWFGRAPLPDLSGLFLGWFGTTGIITKLGIKLYPAYKYTDLLLFVCKEAELMPGVISRLTRAQAAEDMTAWMTPKPLWARGFLHINIIFSADTVKALRFKRDLLRYTLKDIMEEKKAGFMPLPPPQKKRFLKIPSPDLSRFADVKKGGGFEYVGAIMPIDAFPDAYKKGLSIAQELGVTWSMGARIIGAGHAMMFFWAYAFNRADQDDVARAQKALEATNEAALDLGGIPWKAEAPAQDMILSRMDPGAKGLIKRVKEMLDPAHIMNPGNWEEKGAD